MSDRIISSSIPSANEILRTKLEIKALEGELEETLMRVAVLTRTLNEKRGSIAPIRRANFDILSSVFEIAAKDDWKSPLCIGAVSRLWRMVILRTPRAWRFVDRRYIHREGVELYYQRSQNAGLHIRERGFMWGLNHLSAIAHKVKCLNWHDMERFVIPPIFSNLHRLVTWKVDMSIITSTYLPNLRNLEVDTISRDSNPHFDEFPPLDTFAAVMRIDWAWFNIIENCRNSLQFLKLTVLYPMEPQGHVHISLPRLRYLKVINCGNIEGIWPIKLATPTLETYIESDGDAPSLDLLHKDLDSVLYIRLQRFPPLEVLQRLRMIQADMHLGDVEVVLDMVRNDTYSLPDLRSLELRQSYISEEDVQKIRESFATLNPNKLPRLSRPPSIVETYSTELPGEEAFEVRQVLALFPHLPKSILLKVRM